MINIGDRVKIKSGTSHFSKVYNGTIQTVIDIKKVDDRGYCIWFINNKKNIQPVWMEECIIINNPKTEVEYLDAFQRNFAE